MSSSPSPSTPSCNSGRTLAFLTLRLWLGLRAVVAGVEKFSTRISIQEPLLGADGKPDPSGAIVEIERKVYGLKHYNALPDSLRTKFAEEPLLPAFLTTPFYAVLGPALILLGLMLLLGIASRPALFAMGVLYTVLTVGLMLIGQDAGVSWLAIHAGLVALALSLSDANRFSLTRA